MNVELIGWADRLAAASSGIVTRVMVLTETDSTQAAARRYARGRAGLLVIAGRQTAGRGRLGRVWTQAGDLGVAMTLALDRSAFAPERLSICAGLAAVVAVERALSGKGQGVGLRWPNDVVERFDDGDAAHGRKFAGVVIEAADELAVLGIGINVHQQQSDWPEALRGRAMSIREAGGRASRIEIAEAVLIELARLFAAPLDEIVEAWRARDVLLGTRVAFMHTGERVEGLVEAISPMHEIVVRRDDGGMVRLPALSTSVVG